MKHNKSLNLYFIKLFIFLSVTGCSSVREYMGIDKVAPNEYETVQQEPLEIPVSTVLITPQVGIPRPQTKHTPQNVRNILIPSSVHPSFSMKKNSHNAEHVLLKKIKSEESEEKIRNKIDSEGQNEPTLQDKIQKTILFWKKPKQKGNVINPLKEEKMVSSSESPDSIDPSSIEENLEDIPKTVLKKALKKDLKKDELPHAS